ncbi:hypothetical protein WA577_003709, partial [Blastocystis sp. JDR]
MLPFWEYTFDSLLFFVSVLLPCVLFLYDQSASSVFSSAWTRFLALCTVAIAAAGATCLLAATYFFLEKVSSFVFAFSGVFTLLSWLLFLVYVPYGLVCLPWTFLSAFIARVRKRSDAQYTQRVQQAEAFREELKHALPAELQVAEKLAALQQDFGREQRKLALRVKVNRQIRKVSQVLQRVVKEKEEQWGLVCRVEAEKLQRAGEASFIVWSLLLFVGFLLSTILSITVLLQTLLYSIPLVLAGKPLVSALTAWLVSIQDCGVALILLLTVVLCLHLQLCVLSSLRTLGLSISWVRVFPLQQHATLANALLVNAAVLLALLPATLHFLTLLFRDAFDSTALLTLLLRFERGRFLSHVTDYAGLQSLLLLLTLASVLAVGTGSLCRACRSRKRRETEETAVVVSGEPPSSRSSPSSWRRWLQGLKKKEDLDATLRLEWARLCMMVEA